MPGETELRGTTSCRSEGLGGRREEAGGSGGGSGLFLRWLCPPSLPDGHRRKPQEHPGWEGRGASGALVSQLRLTLQLTLCYSR